MSRHRPRTFLILLCSSALFAAVAHGAALTSAIKTSATPAAYAVQIQGFIDQTAKGLTSAEPLVQEARKKLINECENHTGAAASPQFQTEYAKDLNKSLTGILKASNDLHVRLNVAIVADEVAVRVLRGGGDVSVLSPLVQTLLGDKQTAIVLWGMKAAKQVMADTMQQGADPTKISKAIVKSLKAHLDVGVVVEEAYNALTIKVIQQADIYDTIQRGPQFAGTIVRVIPDLLDVIALRTQQFHSGTLPPSPQAEETVSVFLSVTAYPAISANPALLNRTLKVMGNLTCSVVGVVSEGNNTPEMIDVVREDGSFFSTIGQQMQNQGIQDAAKFFSTISVNSDPTQMGKYRDGLVAALGAVGVTISSDGTTGAAPEVPVHPAIAGSSK